MFNIINIIKQAKIVQSLLQSKNKHIKIAGIDRVAKTSLSAALFLLGDKPLIIVLPSRDELRSFRRDLSVFLPEERIVELYPDDLSTVGNTQKSLEVTASRVILLRELYENKKVAVIMTAEAFSQKLPAPEHLFSNGIKINVGKIYKMDEAILKFASFGYERTDIVENPGQFCVRGGIIDIFPLNELDPMRIEWLDDEIDSIRMFDAETQRSLSEIDEIKVMPLVSEETILRDNSVLNYMPDGARIIFDEPGKIDECIDEYIQNIEKEAFSLNDFAEHLDKKIKTLSLSLLPTHFPEFAKTVNFSMTSVAPYHRQMELLFVDIEKALSKNISPIICMSSEAKAVGLSKNLQDRGFKTKTLYNDEDFQENTVLFTVADIPTGFYLKGENWLLITEQDVFGVMKRRRLRSKKEGKKIKYFSEIKAGDYVVHSVHGIGKYLGSETLLVSEVHRDYLVIRYAGDDKLYIPIEQVSTLEKYIGSEGHIPRLSRMGGGDWQRVRSRAKNAVTEMAVELLRLQAERKIIPGYAFSPDTPWQQEFEDDFPFEETDDQLRAVADIKGDMQKPYPMDRILCGDVGYGKTEVAIRAAFKAVMDGKQVAVLVPTTVLAQQHFLTFSDRMQSFGINVDMVSRFRTKKEQKSTLEKVAEHKIDVLIGTHRLIQADVKFQKLGLLIIDEEQRFGVAQKEKIKHWTKNIDVLVLSATPIPRTLHMGLINARDMSIIETPPEDRLPVETYVVEYEEELVKNAILREVRRSGFVYYVYNRVKDIDRIAEKLAELVPEARVKVAHGQMSEVLLENVMIDFYQGEFDVLVCTSIIENGLDVPLANTIIIHNAEKLGLSQLYQMRGRVGRSNRLAYAYFLYPKQKTLTEIAQKRLHAIREFTDLGAGFRIAMRDLEIRGAGNILGAQQSGHMLSVGFETYCRLLDETIKELSEQEMPLEKVIETTIEIDIDAYIPEEYIEDPGHRFDLYKRLQYVKDDEAMRDLIDEVIDRFGSPPKAVINLIELAYLRAVSSELGIKSANLRTQEVKIIFDDNAKINIEALLNFTKEGTYAANLRQGPPVELKLRRIKTEKNVLVWYDKLLRKLII